MKTPRGFSLAELLVGISIMAIMSVVAIMVLGGHRVTVKANEVTSVMDSIIKGEIATKTRTGSYVAMAIFPAVAAGATGTDSRKPSAVDRLQAGKVGLELGGAMYGRYACAVSTDGLSASCCGWSDVDGDGGFQMLVAYLPARAADGSISAIGSSATPDAPCGVDANPNTPGVAAHWTSDNIPTPDYGLCQGQVDFVDCADAIWLASLSWSVKQCEDANACITAARNDQASYVCASPPCATWVPEVAGVPGLSTTFDAVNHPAEVPVRLSSQGMF